jgi:nucleotide-binding universal stress UspA family protein
MVQATEIEAELRAYAQQTLLTAAAPLQQAGLSVETTVVDGRAATAIVEESERFGAELIIVGARGHGAIESMVLGSVSAEVLDTAPAPVLIARGRALNRILLATDGSPSAERAVAALETWPIFKGAAIHVVTVSEPSIPWWATGGDAAAPVAIPVYLEALDEIRVERHRLVDSLAARLQTAGFATDTEVREGRAAEEILAAAVAWNAEVIVMGTHGRTGLVRIALGSVARNVVHHARASVLVVRGAAPGRDAKPGG